MTIEEVHERFGVSINSLENCFPRTQKSILKKWGVHLIKTGRGKSAVYDIEEEMVSDCRALTMYEEIKDDIILSKETLKLMNWTFGVFLGIIFTPMLVFRGSYKDFLNYIQATPSDNNISALKDALKNLEDSGYLSYTIDKTNEDYFVAALYRKTEEEMKIGIDMVKRCKAIADRNHKQSYIPLLKTWLGMQIMSNEDVFQMSDLERVTGLSAYQVREAKKLLEADDIFKTTKAYLAFDTCIGSHVDMNGFYN